VKITLGACLLILPVLLGAAKRPELPQLGYPLAQVKPGEVHSEFNDKRRGHRHHAIDLMRPRGTPVMAVTDGKIRKLYRSRTGGISIYLFDVSEEYCFFYAHLDHYAKNLHEGQEVHKGDVIAYVGHTGNAKRSAPHLHFAVSLTGPERRWSGGVAIDPYPMLLAATPPSPGNTGVATAEPNPSADAALSTLSQRSLVTSVP
jgi:murein DD-endopeptidase MepM/ murein hydrolase activator NlpD